MSMLAPGIGHQWTTRDRSGQDDRTELRVIDRTAACSVGGRSSWDVLGIGSRKDVSKRVVTRLVFSAESRVLEQEALKQARQATARRRDGSGNR